MAVTAPAEIKPSLTQHNCFNATWKWIYWRVHKQPPNNTIRPTAKAAADFNR